MIAKLPLVPFEIINLTRLTVGVCMKVRFKSKVTRGFSLSHRFATRLRRFAAISRLKKNLWDQGKRTHISKLINFTKAFSRIKFVSEPKTMLLFCKHGKLNQSRIPLFCINKKSSGFPASTSFWTQSYTNSC